jgi:dTDP-4-amino-4,6-dideoxygalactose transaminase
MNEKSNPEALVPMSSPDISAKEKKAVAAVLETRHLSMGPYVQEFEKKAADYSGKKHAIAVNSGTAGLHLCVRAAGINTGDLVITTPFSFVASSNVILFEGGIPVFVDVDRATGNIDIDQVRQAVNDLSGSEAERGKWLPRKGAENAGKVKALLPVDVFGQPAEISQLAELAARDGLVLIEDACEAIGGENRGERAGQSSDMAVFAFYPNKQMTTGEGGVVVCDHDQKAGLMRALRNQGRAPGDTWLEHTHLGYNYRMDEMSAALGSVQIDRLDEMIAKRAQVADWFSQRLAEITGIERPQIAESTTRMSWFVYVVRLGEGIQRSKLANRLAERGIPTRPYFAPIHLQPFMVERFGYQEGDYPVTEELGRRGLALPFSSVMQEDEVELVCGIIQEEIAKL